MLVQCDPSIKAILVKIDTEHRNDFIIEDIDDETLLIKSAKEDQLKALLKDVCIVFLVASASTDASRP